MNISYETALYIAKKIQKERPQYALCGSVALMLAGVIEKGQVSDLDFACFESEFKDIEPELEQAYKNLTKDVYSCYKVQGDTKNGYYYNVFTHKPMALTCEEIDGVKIQNIREVITWKLAFGRDKDLKAFGIESAPKENFGISW